MDEAGGDGAVASEGKGLDLDFGRLPGIDEADVLVLQEGFNFQRVVLGHDDHQHLGLGDDAADGAHGELLHGAVHRRGERHQLAAGVRLDQFLAEAGGFLFGFVEGIERQAAGFGDSRVALAFCFVDGGGEFLEAAALSLQVGLLFDANLFLFQVAVF